MSENISGFGLRVVLTASTTFPVGLELTQFADDTDPFDIPEITVAETGMGLNGDLVIWARAVPIQVSVSVIANTPDDRSLETLLEANRVAKGKRGARDIINLSGIYPDGRVKIMRAGAIITGVPGNGISANGRYKTKTYRFIFENQAGT